MRNQKRIRVFVSALTGGSMLFVSGCSDIIGPSIKDGILSFITGSVVDPTFTSQLNDFVLDVFTSNLGFLGSGAIDPSTL
jgi:hypothetical protein